MSKLEELETVFKQAKEKNLDVALELTVPTRTATEIIIVKRENLDYKLDYYKSAYNENLELIRNPEIKMVSYVIKDLSDIMEVGEE